MGEFKNEDVVRRTRQAVDEATEAAQSAWEQAKERSRGMWEQAKAKSSDALDMTQDAVKKYPGQAILIAALAGIALGAVLAARSGKD